MTNPFPGMNPFMESGVRRQQLFPELPQTPYFAFVARKTSDGWQEEGYPIRLQDSLPVIGLPLGQGRPDLPLDWGRAYSSAWELCGARLPVDYIHEKLTGPLGDSDRAWIREQIAPESSGIA